MAGVEALKDRRAPLYQNSAKNLSRAKRLAMGLFKGRNTPSEMLISHDDGHNIFPTFPGPFQLGSGVVS